MNSTADFPAVIIGLLAGFGFVVQFVMLYLLSQAEPHHRAFGTGKERPHDDKPGRGPMPFDRRDWNDVPFRKAA